MGQPLVRQSPSPSLGPAPFFPGWAGRLLIWGCSRPLFSGRIFSSLPVFYLPVAPLAPSAEVLQAAPGPQTAGTVVIIAILSVLLAVPFPAALLTLLIFTWYVDRVEIPLGGWGP